MSRDAPRLYLVGFDQLFGLPAAPTLRLRDDDDLSDQKRRDRLCLTCFANSPEPSAEPVTANPRLHAAFDQTLVQIDKHQPEKARK